MTFVILAIIAALIAIAGFIGYRVSSNREDRGIALFAGIGATVATLIILAVGSFTTVSANTVGVVTSFGSYRGTVSSGVHWLAPWDDVEEFGTRIQPLEMDGVGIRFEGNSGGTANLLVEWRIQSDNEPDIQQLWSDYHTFAQIQDRIVQSRARNALNIVLSGYTPNDGVSGASIPAIQTKALQNMQGDLQGTGVIVERVTIRQIDPDAASQDRINRQVQANADLSRMAVNQQIADREAAIAHTRATTQTPGTIQQSCLDIVSEWDAAKHGPLPATFSCGLGSGAPVLVGR